MRRKGVSGEMKARIVTAVCIIAFFGLVQPSEIPPMWIVAALSIGSYEILAQSTNGARRAQKRRRVGARKVA